MKQADVDPEPSSSHMIKATPIKQLSNLFSGSLAGAGWMLLACMAFTSIALVVRAASHYLSIFEIVFYRNIVPASYSAYWMFKHQVPLRTANFKWVCILAIAGVFSNLTYGYGLAHLPFSTVNALNYTAPIFMALMGFFLFQLPVQKPVILAFFFAFVGVVLLLQPKSLPAELWTTGLISLFSGFAAGLFNLLIYRLGMQGEPSYRLLCYFGLFAVFVNFMIVTNTTHFHQPHGVIWLYIVLLGGLTTTAQLLLVKSFRKGEPHITNLFSYSTILYSVLIDWFVFQKTNFNGLSAIGIALILGGGLMVSWLNPGRPSKN